MPTKVKIFEFTFDTEMIEIEKNINNWSIQESANIINASITERGKLFILVLVIYKN